MRGELLTGMLDKGTVGNTSGGVIHHIWLDDGKKKILLIKLFIIYIFYMIIRSGKCSKIFIIILENYK